MAPGTTLNDTKDEPHAMMTPSIQFLADAQTVLFDAGRWLLTGAVTLFLGYAILVLSALLVSAVAGVGPRRRQARSSQEATAPVQHRGRHRRHRPTKALVGIKPGHRGLSGVVAMSGGRSVRTRS